jgi:DNA-binding XRE family transcriptional regulator
MKSNLTKMMPSPVRSALSKLGADLSVARRAHRLTEAMMAERIGVGRMTYRRAESGDPTVAMGVYASAMFVLGALDRLEALIDPRTDDQMLLFGEDALPKRVRTKKTPVRL